MQIAIKHHTWHKGRYCKSIKKNIIARCQRKISKWPPFFKLLLLTARLFFKVRILWLIYIIFCFLVFFLFFLTQEKTESILVFENQSIRKGFFFKQEAQKSAEGQRWPFFPLLIAWCPHLRYYNTIKSCPSKYIDIAHMNHRYKSIKNVKILSLSMLV